MPVIVERLGVENAGVALEMVQRLLAELGEEGDELGALDSPKVLEAWTRSRGALHAFVARDSGGHPVGMMTVVESFAIYAEGHYGIINEMYVVPPHRSSGVGHQLIQAVKEFGVERRWTRIDVTAPESERWARTRAFYEREGFRFAGPKLKLLLKAQFPVLPDDKRARRPDENIRVAPRTENRP
jgi:GNAT superfamily N-acetyltransferase